MTWMIRITLALALALAASLAALWLFFGRAAPYVGPPVAPRQGAPAEVLVEMPLPPGNVAVAADGRIFVNVHPFAQARRFADATVFELIDGTLKPFPDAAFQARYQGVFGMTVDRRQRLWAVEPAGLDHERTRLLAFDLDSGALVFEHAFDPGVARFAQDLRMAPDGRHLILADTGLFKFTPPGLIVFDLERRSHRVLLADHPSTQPQDWLIRTVRGPHRMAGGLLNFAVGIDGITFSADGRWLVYGAMSHDTLYRVPVQALLDPALDAAALAAQVEAMGPKPLSDGLATDADDGVLITDIEHGRLVRRAPDGSLTTLAQPPGVIWADGVAVAPDGTLLFTDSAIPHYLDPLGRPPAKAVLDAGAPYRVWRVRP